MDNKAPVNIALFPTINPIRVASPLPKYTPIGPNMIMVRGATINRVRKGTLNIFVDNSVVEIYINKGEKVLTSRVFPSVKQKYIYSKKSLRATIWSLKSTNFIK